MSEDRDPNNPARRIVSEGRRKKQESEGETKRKAQFEEAQAARKRNLDAKRVDLEEAQLDAQIDATKRGTPEITIQSQLDVLLAQLKAHMEYATALDEAVRRMKEIVIQECKGNRTEIRKRHLIIDEWRRRQMPEAQ